MNFLQFLNNILPLENEMCWSKNNEETKLKTEKAPQLFDTDGNSCQPIHKATKMFFRPFRYWM